MEGTQVARDPRIHLVGYGPSASTIGATRAGRAAAVAITELLGQSSRPQPPAPASSARGRRVA